MGPPSPWGWEAGTGQACGVLVVLVSGCQGWEAKQVSSGGGGGVALRFAPQWGGIDTPTQPRST